jgi:hypothetical protein
VPYGGGTAATGHSGHFFGESVQLSDELIAERRAEAAIEDGPTLAG